MFRQGRETWHWLWAATMVPGLLLLFVWPGNISGQNGSGGGITNPAQSAELEEARRLNNEARKLSGEGRYAEAIPLTERAVSLREKVPGVGNPELDAVMGNLAFLYKNTGDYARAESLFQKALALREQALGTEHLGIAELLNDFALLYMAKGDNDRAEPLLLRALSIREKALGADHMEVGGVLNSLARVYQARGDDDRAAPLFERVLKILEKGVGREHRFVAMTRENLARVSRRKGDHARAIELYENSLAIFEKTLGPEHAEIAFKLNTLAEYYRELRLQVSGESRQPPLVIANPQFSHAPSAAADKEGDASSRRSGDLRDVTFSPLPGTAGEAKALAAILNVTPLVQAAATETALKGVAAPRILHVATHGFFLPDQKPATVDGGATRGLGLAPTKNALPATATTAATSATTPSPSTATAAAPRVENPLLRSGIALAGANARQSANGEDGILTALEATGLNLWGTKLVLLSACETGLGKVEIGEGVYGLRRALVLAGSESQVISLWQVSDAATRDLMVAYYKRLQTGEGRTEALRQVQLEMLKGGTTRNAADGQRGLLGNTGSTAGTENRSHPFYWASFIQSGEWRAMESAPTGRNKNTQGPQQPT